MGLADSDPSCRPSWSYRRTGKSPRSVGWWLWLCDYLASTIWRLLKNAWSYLWHFCSFAGVSRGDPDDLRKIWEPSVVSNFQHRSTALAWIAIWADLLQSARLMWLQSFAFCSLSWFLEEAWRNEQVLGLSTTLLLEVQHPNQMDRYLQLIISWYHRPSWSSLVKLLGLDFILLLFSWYLQI